MASASRSPRRRPIHPTFPTADECLLISNYLHKFPYEDLDDVDNSVYYHPRDAHRFSDCSAHQVVKRFLKLVRESGGYDVDCFPPEVFMSPLFPIQLDAVDNDTYMSLAKYVALPKINSETRRAYEFVRLLKIVRTSCFVVFLTFTAKQWDTQELTFRDIVGDPPPTVGVKELLEWRVKPVDAVAAAAKIDGWYMWNGHDFVVTPLYMWNGHNYVLYSSPTTYMWNGHEYVVHSSPTS